jgi:hypothetical protein
MGWHEQEAARHGYPVTGGEQQKMRAADADRDRAAGILGTAYGEGRLSRDEHDARLEDALSARTYADLDQVVSDLSAGHAPPVSPAGRTSGLAVASLACGLAQAGERHDGAGVEDLVEPEPPRATGRAA